MKMSATNYTKILETFKENRAAILAHKSALLLPENKNWNNLDVRLAFDALHDLLGTSFICYLYDTENLHDNHIQTAAIKALKTIEVL